MSWSFTLALLFLLLWVVGSLPSTCTTCAPFGPPSPIIQYLFYAFAIAGVVMLIIYLILCTKCSCGWVYRLLWRVLSGAGLLYAIYAGCGWGWLSVIIGAILVLIAWFVFLPLWKKQCCVSECDYLKEIVLWIGVTVVAFATVLLAMNIGSGCLFVAFAFTLFGTHVSITVLAVVNFLFAIFTARYLRKCA